MNIDYTLWPNTDENLGNLKVQIPDGINTTWPEGDALVGNFVYKNGLLSGFVDTKALTVNDSKSTIFPYDYVNIHLASIKEGDMTVEGGAKPEYLIVTYGTGNSGDAIMFKYKGCKTVSDVKAVEPYYQAADIVDGAWAESLADLDNGQRMFQTCSRLTSFSSDLSSLTNASDMFMKCTNLTTFTSDLPSLTNGEDMFSSCSKLTSFSSDLPSLTNGSYMFSGCKLDTASVQNIADTINTVSSGTIHIGIGNSAPNSQEEETFNTIASKGWTVYVNGSKYTPTSPAAITTLDENGEETTTPIPFWAKPVPSDEEHAQYVDEQGNFYNILGAQFIYGDDLSTYGMFTCEEDAAANMHLTKIEKN